MTCNRCDGKGTLSIALGVSDPERDTHKPYDGPWHVFPPIRCPVCYGKGTRRDRPNTSAGWIMHLNSDGYVVSKRRPSLIGDTNQGEMTWELTPDGSSPP